VSSTFETLRKIELLEHFPDEQLQSLLDCTSWNGYPKGVHVIRHGDDTREAYLLEKGRVRVQRDTPYGQYGVAELGAGEFFGETSFIDREERGGDIFVLEDSELRVLNAVAMAMVMEKDPRFAVALHWTFWKSLSRKLRLTNGRLTEIFLESGAPPGSATAEPPAPAQDFHLALADKRTLFQEQKLSNLEINFLTSLSREEKYDRGEVIFRDGAKGDRMYVVLEGRVMISKDIPGAGEEALAFLDRGDYFGEMALIDKEPRSADAKAAEPGTVVLAIPRRVVEGILDIHKVSSISLLRILCGMIAQRLRDLDEKLVGWYILGGGGSQGSSF